MAGKGKRNLTSADLAAMNRGGPIVMRYPAGGGRPEMRIGNSKPPRTPARTKRGQLHPPPTPPTG